MKLQRRSRMLNREVERRSDQLDKLENQQQGLNRELSVAKKRFESVKKQLGFEAVPSKKGKAKGAKSSKETSSTEAQPSLGVKDVSASQGKMLKVLSSKKEKIAEIKKKKEALEAQIQIEKRGLDKVQETSNKLKASLHEIRDVISTEDLSVKASSNIETKGVASSPARVSIEMESVSDAKRVELGAPLPSKTDIDPNSLSALGLSQPVAQSEGVKNNAEQSNQRELPKNGSDKEQQEGGEERVQVKFESGGHGSVAIELERVEGDSIRVSLSSQKALTGSLLGEIQRELRSANYELRQFESRRLA